MKTIGKYILLFVVALVSLYGAAYASYWVGEHYFFDQLFYQKSAAHGYYAPHAPIAAYGRRSSDLTALHNFMSKYGNNPATYVLGQATDGVFTVVVMGDSYVWGQGVRDNERFPVLLEKKLNAVRPSRVISLANPGDDIYNHYIRYRDIQKMISDVDVYIFSLVDNDLLFNNYSEDESLKIQLAQSCTGQIIFNVNGSGEKPHLYERLMSESYNPASGNICLFHQLLPFLPLEKAIYFDTQYDKTESYMKYFVQPLVDRGLQVIVPDYPKIIPSYKEYVVSDRDGHPSRAAHEVFAVILFKTIQSAGKLSQ